MCGRKAHRVRTAHGDVFTVPVEMVFNAQPAVRRTALVGVSDGAHHRPVLVVEPVAGSQVGDEDLARHLEAVAEGHPVAGVITDVLVHREPFPVDIRHNAKIRRPELAAWAADRLGA
jgi:acyl-CoA synthetase (AMP-forming)/AMP-acid ligase II